MHPINPRGKTFHLLAKTKLKSAQGLRGESCTASATKGHVVSNAATHALASSSYGRALALVASLLTAQRCEFHARTPTVLVRRHTHAHESSLISALHRRGTCALARFSSSSIDEFEPKTLYVNIIMLTIKYYYRAVVDRVVSRRSSAQPRHRRTATDMRVNDAGSIDESGLHGATDHPPLTPVDLMVPPSDESPYHALLSRTVRP